MNQKGLTHKSNTSRPKATRLQIQPKLMINKPGDRYEREADAMADRVMRMNVPGAVKSSGLVSNSLQRKCAGCEESEKKKKVMRKETGGGGGYAASPALVSKLNNAKAGGNPLPTATKNFMEHAFSVDFSNVRIHTDAGAGEMSNAIAAKGFTFGRDIYLHKHYADISSNSGRRLLAHELTHVVQNTDTIRRQTATHETPIGEVYRVNEQIPIHGAINDQPNFADHAFQCIFSAPLGDTYNFCPNCGNGKCLAPVVSVAKKEFMLDSDPTLGFLITIPVVYKSREIALQVISDLERLDKKSIGNAHYLTYYLRQGFIFPTTKSEGTLPILVHNLRLITKGHQADLKATADLAENLAWWYVAARFPAKVRAGNPVKNVPKVPPPAAFNALTVVDELFTSTQSIANAGQRMLQAAKALSGMKNLTAVQKAEVILAFFKRIGFGVKYIKGAAWVDEGAHLVMYAENGKAAFRFIKVTGEIIYGKFDFQKMEYIWNILK